VYKQEFIIKVVWECFRINSKQPTNKMHNVLP